MDLRTLVTISLLLLMFADQTTLGLNATDTSFSNLTTSNSTNCSCTSAAPATTAAPSSTSRSDPVLSLLTVTWRSRCEGDLILHHPSNSSPFCYDRSESIRSLLRNVCEYQEGCKDKPLWVEGRDMLDGYDITGGTWIQCKTLTVQCTVAVLPNIQAQLQAYKVVTALLCCLLLVLVLICFTRPTVRALQKRLSERRQNRWIGPTQSHSVSYNRGKTAVKNYDGEKRLSYPGLERLTVMSAESCEYNF